MKDNFTNQKARIATEKDVHASWSGGKDGKYFKCYLCGHKFEVGEYWRWVYSGDTINFVVCSTCDGPDVKERFKKYFEEYKKFKEKYWAFEAMA